MGAPPEHRGGFDRQALIESHLPLVRAIARRYAGQAESLDDLIQVGAVELVRASDRFDPQRGVAFATFAAPAVEGEIRRHVGDRSGSVRIPRELRRMTGQLEHSRAKLAASLGRAPTVSELATALGVKQEEVEQALKAQRARQPAPEGSEDDVGAEARSEPLQATDDRLLLAAGAHVLDERERRIVFLRFHADMTEREIGREVGISQAQVSRLLDRALSKLREALEDKDFSPGARDTTEKGVVSEPQAPRGPQPSPSSQQKHQTSGRPATKIATVEEQAQAARQTGASPKEDVAMPYHVTVKPTGGGRSSWIASLDELPGCEARGQTQDEAVENLRASMEGWLSAAVDEPKVISPPARDSRPKKASSHSGRFLVRMPSTLHEELTKAAEREQVSLNRFVTAQLEASVASPGGGSAASGPRMDPSSAPPSDRRRLRVLLAANVLIIVVAAAAAVALLVLALQRGI